MIKTYTFRCLKINPTTRGRLKALLRHLSWLGKEIVDLQIRSHKEGKPYRNYQAMCKVLTRERQRDPYLAQWPVRAQRSQVERKHLAFQRFFNKQGKFPKKRKHVRSFEVSTLPQPKGKGRYSVQVKGVGKLCFKDKADRLRQVEKIRRVRILTHNLGTGVDIQVVADVADPMAPDTREAIGIDVGVKAAATLSNGKQYPKLETDHTRYKRRQRKLAKARKGARSRVKKQRAAAKEAQRITIRRRAQIHEITTDIVNHHSTNLVLEALNLEAMTRHGKAWKRGLNRAMRNNALGQLTHQLKYKAKAAGGDVLPVHAAYTTQTCAACGKIPDKKIGLSIRVYHCRFCGHTQDRDINAARNILFKAYPALAGREALCAGKDTPLWGEYQGEAATSGMEGGEAPGTEQDRMLG